MIDFDDHIASFVAVFYVAVRGGSLFKREASIQNGNEFSFMNDLFDLQKQCL